MFDKLDVKKATIVELESFFSDEIKGHVRPTMKIEFEGLVRMRNVTSEKMDDLLSVSSIWYPDWNKIPKKCHSLNRCSDKGQNLFYGSSHFEATLKEINPGHGDLVLVGVFEMKDPNVKAQVQFAGVDRININGRNKLLKDYKFLTKRDEIFENKISEIFRKKIEKGDDSIYKASIAFSNILLKKP